MATKLLQDKIALISGGASGIGAATAKKFIAEGAKVAIADIDEKEGEKLAQSLGLNAAFFRLDVVSEISWQETIKLVQDHFGTLTTIVNSAGISVPSTIEELSFESFKNTIDINLNGVFLGCKYGLAAIKGQKGAAIVNVGSTLGARAGSKFPAYSASKGAVHQLSKSVAMHCAEQSYDVRINSVLPGAIHTAMVEKYIEAGKEKGASREDILNAFANAHPMKRLGRPEEVANAIAFLASDQSTFTTGAELPVDGGILI